MSGHIAIEQVVADQVQQQKQQVAPQPQQLMEQQPLQQVQQQVEQKETQPPEQPVGQEEKAVKENSETNRERELVGQLLRAAQLAVSCSRDVMSVAQLRYDQWCNKELRSRQRATYCRLLEGSVSKLDSTGQKIYFEKIV